eukprot:c24293_g1_i1 orf=385-1629(-)
MSRRCSHCGHNGHNSRTCLDSSKGGFKLFGVRVSADCCASSSPTMAPECSSSSLTAMRKSVSMGNLCNYGTAEGGASPLSPSHFEQPDLGEPVEGYASDDLVHSNSSSRERKKGVPWTEEEHKTFLLGLEKLGKGDWRGISRTFVKTRTPTQVASHAQKYFLRRNNLNKRRRRSSLFDITPDTVSSVLEEPLLEETGCDDDPDVCPELNLGQSIPYGLNHGMEAARFAGHGYPLGYFPVPLHQFPLTCTPMGVSDLTGMVGEAAKIKEETNEVCEMAENGLLHQTPDVDEMEVVPEVVDDTDGRSNQPAYLIRELPVWPGNGLFGMTKHDMLGTECKILRPTPIIPRRPQKVEDAMEISELTINMARRVMEPTPLSYKLLEDSSRHSAFHTTSTSNGNREVDGQGSLNSAISVP